jgi:hypothetical protein
MNNTNTNAIQMPKTVAEARKYRETVDRLLMAGASTSDIYPLVEALRPYRAKLLARRAFLRSWSDTEAWLPFFIVLAMYFLSQSIQETFELSNESMFALTLITFFAAATWFFWSAIRNTRKLVEIAEILVWISEEDIILPQQRM